MSSVLRLLFNGQPAGEVVLRPTIPLDRALLCADEGCQAIYETGAGAGCPACGSRQAVLLARSPLNAPATPAQEVESGT